MHIHDLGEKVGTVLASLGSFVVAQALSDTILNELVRLLSSCLIAALGAAIGYWVTRWMKRREEKRKAFLRDQEGLPNMNPGSKPHKDREK